MKLPRGCTFKAFTLVELLLVLAILVLLVGVSLPLAVNFYKTGQLDFQENSIVQSLRKAQLKAMAGQDDSAFGVYLGSSQYVLFRGDAYGLDPVFDEVFSLPADISLSGLSEIVFSKLEGLPSVTGNIVLTSGSRSETININELGKIDY